MKHSDAKNGENFEPVITGVAGDRIIQARTEFRRVFVSKFYRDCIERWENEGGAVVNEDLPYSSAAQNH